MWVCEASLTQIHLHKKTFSLHAKGCVKDIFLLHTTLTTLSNENMQRNLCEEISVLLNKPAINHQIHACGRGKIYCSKVI